MNSSLGLMAVDKEINEHYSCLSNNIIVHFPGDASLIGEIVDVKLLEVHGFYYMGAINA